MLKSFITVLALLVPFTAVQAATSLVAVQSAQSAVASMDKLEALAQARGLKIFARIDHAAGAHSISQELRPTQLLIFGHPKGGTPLLQCAQTYGLDLPMRVLAWDDAQGNSWLGYQVPMAVGKADSACEPALKRITDTLDGLVREVARK